MMALAFNVLLPAPITSSLAKACVRLVNESNPTRPLVLTVPDELAVRSYTFVSDAAVTVKPKGVITALP